MDRGERRVVLGLVQMSMDESAQANLSKALRMVAEAAQGGAEIVCLPELFTSLYFPREKREDHGAQVHSEPIPGPTTRALSRAAATLGVTVVGGSMYETTRRSGLSYNTSAVFDGTGKMLGRYRKVHIPQDDSFFEQDYFSSGDRYAVFRTPRAKVGVLICFDQWYPEAARIERQMGAEVLFYPTAIGHVDGIEETEGDWKDAWETVQRGHAISNSMVVAAVNRVGREGSTGFWGGSFVSDQFGRIIARADDREQVLLAACDLGLGNQVEDGWGFMRHRKPRTYGKLLREGVRLR